MPIIKTYWNLSKILSNFQDLFKQVNFYLYVKHSCINKLKYINKYKFIAESTEISSSFL